MADLFPDPDWRPSGSYYRTGRRKQRNGFMTLAVAGLASLLVGTGVLYVMLKRNVSLGEVPTIQPETAAIKERPADPGGLDVPHQDATVYDRLDKRTASHEKVEQLLPPPEKPNEKAMLAAAKPPQIDSDSLAKPPVDASKPAQVEAMAEPQSIGVVAQPKAVPAQAEPPVNSKPSPFLSPEQMAEKKAIEKSGKKPADHPVDKPVEKPVEKPADKPVEETVDKTAASTEAKPAEAIVPVEKAPTPLDVKKVLERAGVVPSDTPVAPKKPVATADLPKEPAAKPIPKPPAAIVPDAVTAAPTSKGMSRVQLASSPDREAAEQKMLDMVDQHASLLRRTKLTIVRADLGTRGTYYRIQTQPMPTAEASTLCRNLQAVRLPCLLVKAAP